MLRQELSKCLWCALRPPHQNHRPHLVGWGPWGGKKKKKPAPPTADKTRDGSQEVLRSCLLCHPFRSAFNNLAYHLLCPHCSIVCRAKWHVIRQPDVEVKPILDIFRKKL